MAEDKATPKETATNVAEPAVKKVAEKATKPAAEAEVKKSAKPEAKAVVKQAAKPAVGKVSVTLIRSKHDRLASHKACVAGLGLRRMHQTVEVIDTPENRGMINKVRYLLSLEEA